MENQRARCNVSKVDIDAENLKRQAQQLLSNGKKVGTLTPIMLAYHHLCTGPSTSHNEIAEAQA